MPKKDALDHLSLGQHTDYPNEYDPKQLQPVPRSLNREPIGLKDKLPFSGVDLWTGYEISWLNANGLPQVAVGHFAVPAESPNLIESKSFKLYLNSFNDSRFDTWEYVQQLMETDLSACAGTPVKVKLKQLSELEGESVSGVAWPHCSSSSFPLPVIVGSASPSKKNVTSASPRSFRMSSWSRMSSGFSPKSTAIWNK